MAARVNTKFVFMLSAALVLLVGGIGAYWFIFVHRDPEEMIQRGDQAFAAEEYAEAIDEYGRALGRRPNDADLLQKFINALNVAPVDGELEADRNVGRLREAYRLISEQRRDDPEALEQYYQLLWQMARDGLASYSQLRSRAELRLADDPDNVVARRYRGMAGVHGLSIDIARDEQLQVREDLTMALEHRPDDAELMHYLVRWNLFEANRLDRPAGDREQAAELREEALALSQQMYEQDPDDRERQAMHLQVLLDPTIDEREQAEPILDALEARLLEDPQPRHVVLAAVDMLTRSDRTETEDEDRPRGVVRATQLLEAAAQAHPDEAAYQLTLGRYRQALGETDEALARYVAARDTAERAPAMDYLRWRHVGVEAALRQGDLLVSRMAEAESDEQRESIEAEVLQIIDVVRERNPDAAALSKLRGKLEAMEGEWRQAAVLFDRASSDYDHRDAETLQLAAQAHRRLGEWGAAAERLRRLLELQPRRIETHLQLADIYLNGRELDQAEQHIQAVLAAAPDHPLAQRLHARLLARRGETQQAIEVYEDLDNVEDGQAVMELVQLYLRSQQLDEAVALLERRLAEAPTDLRALQALLGLDNRLEDADVAVEPLFERAVAEGADEQTVDRLRRLHAGEEISIDEALSEAIASREDPLDRALMRAEIARRRGETDAFRDALDEAEQIDGHNDRVVELQFELALMDEDWERAERYARVAGEHNIDDAEGAFYRGRLALAQENYRTAVAHLRTGCAALPVYSEGWRLLGDALRYNRDLDEALDAYRRAVDQQPDNVAALQGLAAVHDAQGDHDEALAQLREALEHGGNNPRLLEQYLQYEQTHGDLERAIRIRRQLAEVAEDLYDNRRVLAALLAQTGETQEALAEAEALVEDEGATRTNVALLAEVHRRAGDAEAGLAVIEDYLAERGEAASARDQAMLARYRLSINDGEGAVSAFERAMAMDEDPQQPVTREYADLLFERGAFAEAAPLYRRLHEALPDDASVALRLAEAHIQLGEADEAEAILERVPESPERRALEAIVARAEGDLEAAREAIDRAIAIDGSNPLLYVERARIRMASETDRAAAEDDLEQALRRAPGLSQARLMLVQLQLAQGNTSSAKSELRTLLSQNPRQSEARLLLLELYLNDEEYRAADNLVAEAQRAAPQDPLWPRMRARVAQRQGDVDAAIGHWRDVLELEATPPHLAAMTTYQLEQERFGAALETLEAHESLLEQYGMLEALRGWALAGLEEDDASMAAFTTAIRAANSPSHLNTVATAMMQAWGASDAIGRLDALEGDLPQLKRHLVAAQIEVASRAFQQAADRLEAQSAELENADEGQRLFGHRLLAAANHQLGNHARARAAYEQILAISPDDVAALNNLAYLLAHDLDQAEEALPLAERAAELAPNNAQVLDTLGWTQYKVGLHEQAQATLEQALSIEPLAPTYVHLGTLHQTLGDEERAIELLGEAVTLAQQSGDQASLEQAEALLAQLQP